MRIGRLFFLLFFLTITAFPALAQDDSPSPPPLNALPNLLDHLDRTKSAPEPPRKQSVPGMLKDPLLKKKPQSLPYQNFDQIPEEAIAEAEQFRGQCLSEYHRSSHYDCECLAMRFLERRIIQGPEAHPSAILLDIRTDCPNMPGAAGFAYSACISQSISFFPSGQDPEEYCSCVGNAYARLFKISGRPPDARQMTRMRTYANLSCIRQPPGVPPLVEPIP